MHLQECYPLQVIICVTSACVNPRIQGFNLIAEVFHSVLKIVLDIRVVHGFYYEANIYNSFVSILEGERTMKYNEDPARWRVLLSNGHTNIITAIKQLRRIEWSDEDIVELVRIELAREDRKEQLKKEREQ